MNTEQEYDEWHRKLSEDQSPTECRLAQWHEDALSLAPPLIRQAVILEVGCGHGDFSIHLSRSVQSVTGVDFSPMAINIAKKKGSTQGSSAHFQIEDAQALSFQDNTFDIVFSCECLEHIPNPAKALKEMARVLKPGGHLLLTTENYSNAMLLYWAMALLRRRPFNSGSGPQPIENFFLFWRVRKMISDSGFRVLRMLGAHHVFFALPGCHPHLFVRERFRHPLLVRLLRPFARHVSFVAVKA